MVVVSPFRVVLLLLLALVGGAASDDDKSGVSWGTLRPNVYVGARAEYPSSPLFGLMWFDPDDPEFVDHIRHDCDVRDEMDTFGWLEHTGHSYGHQLFLDGRIGVNITVDFVHLEGSSSFAFKVHARRYKSKQHALYPSGSGKRIAFVWYVAVETRERQGRRVTAYPFSLDRREDTQGSKSNAIKGDFDVHLGESFTVSALQHKTTHFEGLHRASPEHWDVKAALRDRFMALLRSNYMAQLKKHQRQNADGASEFEYAFKLPLLKSKWKPGAKPSADEPNMAMFQRVSSLPTTFYVVLRAHHDHEEDVSIALIDERIQDARIKFHERFSQVFALHQKEGLTAKHERMAKAAVSNMLGGIGYFAGDTVVQEEHDLQPRLTTKKVLFSAVPSRSFFPRGFLWDEGFHQLLISQWDVRLSMKVIRSWFGQMREDGWIPREQIMGGEGRSRVPQEFQIQRPHVANPPTMFAAVLSIVHQYEALLQTASEERDEDLVDSILLFLNEVGPKMKTHLDWFTRTQGVQLPASGKHTTSFRWKGRTLDHCLSSGLDDYPRAPWLSDDEAHVDLHSWIMFMLRVSTDIQTKLSQPAAKAHLESMRNADAAMQIWVIDSTAIADNEARYETLAKQLDDLFWSEKEQMYCDWIDHVNATSHHVCFPGYISLFPLLNLQLDANSDKLSAVLELLRDDKQLWSDYGILSLSKSSPAFHTKEDYWRGNIWMNINFLAVRALHHYGHTDGPHASRALEIYGELRDNVIDNLYKNFFRKGYLYEQYVAETGKGVKSHPFTGWSALIVLIMAEHY